MRCASLLFPKRFLVHFLQTGQATIIGVRLTLHGLTNNIFKFVVLWRPPLASTVKVLFLVLPQFRMLNKVVCSSGFSQKWTKYLAHCSQMEPDCSIKMKSSSLLSTVLPKYSCSCVFLVDLFIIMNIAVPDYFLCSTALLKAETRMINK